MENLNIFTLHGEDWDIDTIGTDLEDMQDYVDGPIQELPITEDIVLICNEEGKLMDLPMTAVLLDEDRCPVDVIVGNIFVCRVDGDEFVSILPEDLHVIQKYLRPASEYYPM